MGNSGSKARYRSALAAEKKQRELFDTEIAEINKEHESRVQNLNSAIISSTERLEELKIKNAAEKSAKEKEINFEKLEHAAKLGELETAYEQKKASMANESKERLKELQVQSKKERDELISAHKKAIEEKKQELKELRESQKAEQTAIEEEHRKIYQERRDEITRHNTEIAEMKENHMKAIADEMNELKEIKKAVLTKQREAIEAESEKQIALCNQLLEAQIAHHNGMMEKDLADSVAHMIKPFTLSSHAIKQLAHYISCIDSDPDLGWLIVKNSTNEWTEGNLCTQNATFRLRQMINNYSTISPEFRENLLAVTNEIDQNILNVQSVHIAIENAVDRQDSNMLGELVPRIEDQIAFLDRTNQKLREVCAPPGTTLKAIQTTPKTEAKQIAIEQNSDQVDMPLI